MGFVRIDIFFSATRLRDKVVGDFELEKLKKEIIFYGTNWWNVLEV